MRHISNAIIFVLLGTGSSLSAALAFESASSLSVNAASLSFSHTPGNNPDRILVVGVGVRTAPDPVVSVTFNGSGLTRLWSSNFSGVNQHEVWYLLNPVSFTADIVVTLNASTKAVAGAVTYSGARQSSPFAQPLSATSNANLVGVTLTSTVAGSWILTHLSNQFFQVATTATAGMQTRYTLGTSGNPSASNVRSSWADLPAPSTGTYVPAWSHATLNNEDVMTAFELLPLPPFTSTATPTSTVTPTATRTPASCAAGRTVLMVVGNLTLSASDQAAKNRLESVQGLTVQAVLDSAVQAADAVGKAFVLVQSSVTGSNIGTRLRDVDVPVWVCEGNLFGNMQMTGANGGVDWYTPLAQDSLDILLPADPLAAGLAGTVAVTGGTDAFNVGIPAASATRVASMEGDAGWSAIFYYDPGDVMMNGFVAQGKRLGYFPRDATHQQLNAAGWALFDAAADWLACQPQLPTPTPTPAGLAAAYREVFPNPGPADLDLANAGWGVLRGAGGTVVAATVANNLRLIAQNGSPTDEVALASFPSSAETALGVFTDAGSSAGQITLFYSEESAVSAGAGLPAAVTWLQGNQSASDGLRVALKVGGAWFASQQVFSNGAVGGVANFNALALRRTLDLSTALWNSLNATPGAALSMGGAAALPAGDIQGYGLLSTASTSTIRFDSFAILRSAYTPTVTPSFTLSSTPTATPSASPSSTDSPTATPSSTPTASPTASPSASPSASPTASPSASPSSTDSPTATPSSTPTASPTASPSASPSASPTASPSATPASTASPTASPSSTPSVSSSASPTGTASATATPTGSPTPPDTATASPTLSGTPSASPSASPSTTPTATPSGSPTATLSATPPASPTATPTRTPAPGSATATPSATPTRTASPSPTDSPTPCACSPTLTSTPGPASVVVILSIYDSNGLRVYRGPAGVAPAALGGVTRSQDPWDPAQGPLVLNWGAWSHSYNGKDQDGAVLRNGVYLLVLESPGATATKVQLRVLGGGRGLAGLEAGPNPVRPPGQTVRLNWTPQVAAELRVYSLDGGLVRDLGTQLPPLDWDLRNSRGAWASNGIYLVTARIPGERTPQRVKLVVAR